MMEIALLVARLLLAAVFFVAAATKLVDRAGTREGIRNFGVPDILARPSAILLPVAELAVAVALVPTPTAWWGGLGALALLLLFTAAIAVNLARGQKPDCRCFGQVHSSPVGPWTLVRNALLAAVAGLVIWQGRDDPGPSAVGWLADLTTAELAAVIAGAIALGLLGALAWFVLNLLRQQGRLLLRIEALESRVASGATGAPAEAPAEPGLPVGSEAPGFRLSGVYGETLTLDALRSVGKPVILLFTDPNCGPCNALIPEVRTWQRSHAAAATIAVVSRGSAEANRAKSAEHVVTTVLLQADNEVADAYQVEGTPSAVAVRPDGTIGSPVAAGADAIRALVARTAGASAGAGTAPAVPNAPVAATNGSGDAAAIPAPTPAPAGAKVGDPVPALKLPDLNAKRVDLAGLRGRRTLVLFWNPQCGFCTQMLDDVKTWEANPPKGAPKLLVVSSGTVEENRAMDLRAPVLLDPSFSAGRALGASGTPSAVLVDEKGKVASEVAAGADEVLRLAGAEPASNGAGDGGATVRIGDPVPTLELADLGGGTVDLTSLNGGRTLLVFWNPQCGFCARMLDDLKAWEADPPDGAPNVVLVSRGAAEDNRAMGLRSPILLDQDFQAGNAFGASGTPMAVLIDEHGRVASDVVGGAPAVLALAGAPQGAADSSASS